MTQRKFSETTANPAPEKKEKPKKSVEDKPLAEPDDKHDFGTKLGHYIFDKSLGKGTFGKVKLAVHTLTKEKVRKLMFHSKRYR